MSMRSLWCEFVGSGCTSVIAVIGLSSDQGGVFEHPAEGFLASALMRAGAAVEVFKGFVADFQALQIHDANKFITAFPGLRLF